MTPILYESDEKEFWSKGLGPLSDAEKCTVTEERNGAYTLSMTYPIDGVQADKIANNRIIKADNAYDLKNQLFVIKTVTPIMTETGEISLSVYAEHISYITNDLSIPPELSLTGTAQQALDQWKDSLIGGDTSGITVDSDVTNTSSTLLTIQTVANARQALGGVEGSILYNWKGEYRFDNLHISLKKQRGTTANTLLSYGRNLLTFEQEQNIAETYTTLYPYALVTTAGGMAQKLVTIDGYLVDSKYVSHYPNRKIKTHDFSSDFQNYRIGAKPSENAEEGVTYADLATIKKYLKGKALHFMTTNDIGVPKISTTITFADLSKTDDELAKFEKLSLCDKVPVRFEKLGINSTIKVTRTVWNVLTDSYDSIELGDLNMTIGETVASVSAETSAIKTKVNQASVTAQIAADGTHNIFRTDDETEPIAKKVGDLWYKIDGKYTSMYQWDGKAWVLIINTRDTADVRAELDQAKSDMEQAKTDAQTAYDEAIKATNAANGAKVQTDEALEQVKQVQKDLSSVTGTVVEVKKGQNELSAKVADKVDNAVYQSYVAQTDKALSAKLTASDLKEYAKTADVKQTTDGLSASITKVQGDLSSLQIGGANLLDDTERERSAKRPNTGATDIFVQGLATPPTGTVFTASFDAKATTDKTAIVNNFFDATGKYADGKCLYTVTCQNSTPTRMIDGRAQLDLSTRWERYWVTWTWSQEMTQPHIHAVIIGEYNSNFADGTVYIRRVKLEKGNKATDWCMSDNDFQSQLNTLSGKITATSDRLSSVYTKSEVDGKLGTKVEQSALTQTSNNLSASIAKNSKILSSAGLVNENAYINANRIALNGKTLMTNATINDAFIGSINANKITTGTLNAAKVNLINVNASNISTGTLNGVKITSTGKDPSGTSSTTKIESGYIDTNVINCSDYILVGKADADPRKRWQTKQDSFGMWFTCPAKITGHTGNSASDYQTEMQGFIGSDGWDYKNVAISGTGRSGIQLALTSEQAWGKPYGGDQWSIGNWIETEDSFKSGDIRDGALDPVMWYSCTGQGAAYADQLVIQKATQFFAKANFQDGVRIGVTGANHGIRTAWVSWSDWGSNQKIPCIVNDTNNWGGIAFPSNGRVVLFTHGYRINTDGLPKDKVGSYTGYGD